MSYTKCRLTANVVSKCHIPYPRDAPYDFVSYGDTQTWVANFSPDFVVNSEVVALSIR